MPTIEEAIISTKESLPQGVCLIAVSKTHPMDLIMQAYGAGQRDFGENKVQELTEKAQALPADIRWHMIGHLQTNKVKYIAPFVYLIHSVDSEKLLRVIDKEGAKAGRVIDCLLQVHVAKEDTKFGLSPEQLEVLCATEVWKELPHVRIRGLMAMATNTDVEEEVRQEFALTKALFDKVRQRHFADSDSFDQLSMGMSGDYELAAEEGATMVRVGSSIFGHRYYAQPALAD